MRKEYYQQNKEKVLAKNREWRVKNPEKDKVNKHAYYLTHKSRALKSARDWKERHCLKNKEINHLYKIKNKEKIQIYQKKWNKSLSGRNSRGLYWLKNHEKILLKRREYRKSHPEKAREYMQLRRLTDINFKLRGAIRHRLLLALKGKKKIGSAIRDLGCTVQELKIYLENRFQSGMTWDNWTPKGWHIDHIVALANFDLTNREQFLRACHFTNLQPLWGIENIKKGKK